VGTLLLAAVVTLGEGPGDTPARAEFSCSERVWARVAFAAPQRGPHLLEARWIRPDGRVQERARIPVDLGEGAGGVHAWLDFGDGPGLWERLFGLKPDRTFNGRWKVELTWDGAPLETKEMEVRC